MNYDRIIVKKNDDEKKVKLIEAQLKENDGYCPCSFIKDESTKCMCENFRNAIKRKEVTICHCGLYQTIGIKDPEA